MRAPQPQPQPGIGEARGSEESSDAMNGRYTYTYGIHIGTIPPYLESTCVCVVQIVMYLVQSVGT
jgi:hypothetical protein